MHLGSTARTVDGSYAQVFVATSMFLADRGFPLHTADRAHGRIVTGNRAATRSSAWFRTVEKVSVRIRDRDGTVSVRLLLAFTDQVSDPPRRLKRDGDDKRSDDVSRAMLSQTFDASVVYDDYLDAIQKRVDEMRDAP